MERSRRDLTEAWGQPTSTQLTRNSKRPMAGSLNNQSKFYFLFYFSFFRILLTNIICFWPKKSTPFFRIGQWVSVLTIYVIIANKSTRDGSRSSTTPTLGRKKKSTKATTWSNGPVVSIKEAISTREETISGSGPRFSSTTERVVCSCISFKWKVETVKKK